MTYTLRVSVKTLGQCPITGIDQPVATKIAGMPAVFELRHRHLIMRILGFASETEAASFLPRVKAGLWNMALVHHLAFVPEFRRCEITFAEDPVQAGKNIARSFGLSDDAPVDGLSDEAGYAVFLTDQTIKFLGAGDITATRELDFRKETSIRRRVRELVLTSPGLPADRKEIARSVVRAYDLRGQLVHTGAAGDAELNDAFDTVFQVTKALLRGRLGLEG